MPWYFYKTRGVRGILLLLLLVLLYCVALACSGLQVILINY
jgi:hypothetical protein